MRSINLYEWNIDRKQFEDWAVDSGAELYASIHHSGNGQPSYEYELNEEDFLAFSLAFKKNSTMNLGFYYCPYIPLLYI